MRLIDRLGSWGVPLVVASGVLALAYRVPAPEALLVTAGVGAAGGITPVARAAARERLPWLWVVLLGTLPFLAFAAWSRPLPARGGMLVAVTGVVAAVAEEVFFRRLVYGWLERWGAVLAVGVAALLFALVHVPVYGWGVLP
ncbi:MAG: CPBP family glutamic-type intramembrane protease, partial [Actinomycetota bacterium]